MYYSQIGDCIIMNQEEFYSNIEDWISKPKSTWNHITLMAYFCHKYELVTGSKFRLVRWKGDPGKGKESRDFSKLFKVFATEDYDKINGSDKLFIKNKINNKIYNYINWIFDYKFRSGTQSVTGTGIFLLPSIINEFERMYEQVVEKNTNDFKIKTLIKWCGENCPEIFSLHQLEDMDDLEMIYSYFKAHNLDKSVESRVVEYARGIGLL